jgi:hypothetical protein
VRIAGDPWIGRLCRLWVFRDPFGTPVVDSSARRRDHRRRRLRLVLARDD